MDRGGQTVSATRFAALTGLTRERLRTWERRHGFPEPVRVGSGRRRYAVADITRVVAVRRAAEDGTPLPVAIAQARQAPAPALPPHAFRDALERAPVAVALILGPQPLRLAWANATLRAIAGAPRPGTELTAIEGHRAAAILREHFTGDLPPTDAEHPPWSGVAGAPLARSVVFRLPVRAGERPVVAVLGLQATGEQEARAALARAETALAHLQARDARHDRWLDALSALAEDFQHEPGPDVIGAALDTLVRQTRAIDAGMATYGDGRLTLAGTRRGALGPSTLTVAAHPELGRALRDGVGDWLDATTAAVLGVPAGLHAFGLPIEVAGESLGLLVLLFDAIEPRDADNRRLLNAVSAAMGFAMLRDRLVREVEATVSAAGPRRRG